MPQVSPSALQPSVPIQTDPGRNYQNIPGADPDAFGAGIGRAQQGLGQAGEHFGDVMANAALRMQEQHNQVTSDDYTNKYQNQETALLYGNPDTPGDTGFYGKKGEDAKRAFPELRDNLVKLREGLRGQLQNTAQQLAFDRETRNMQSRALSFAGQHYVRESEAYAKDVSRAGQINGITAAAQAAAAGDDAGWAQGIAQAMRHGLDEVKDQGPDAANAKLQEIRSSAVTVKAEALANTQGDDVAAEFINQNMNAFAGDAGLKLQAHYKEKADIAAATGAVNRALRQPSTGRQTGPGGLTAAQHYNQAIALGASPNEAALLTSAADAESGFDSAKSHDGGIGYGLYGHNAERLAAMRKQFGPTPTAAQQIEFALNELRSRPEGAEVNTAKTPEQLTDLQMRFEQPKRGPTDQAERRLTTTRELMLNPPKAGTAAGGGTTGIIDKTADAGFGNKFGPLTQPQGMVVHHTAGGESVDDVIKTFKKTGFPSQFIIDRQGKIYQTLPDGSQGRHVRNSYGPLGEGKTNENMEGVEIIANNDGDVLPVQQEAAARLIAMRAQKWGYDPKTSVFGHGELNPGHKQADEGMSTVTRIRNGSLSTQMAPPADTVVGQPPATVTATPAAATPGAANTTAVSATGTAVPAGSSQDSLVGQRPPPTAAAPQGPAPPYVRGQQTLAILPDYLRAKEQLQQDPTLNDHRRKLALDQLRAQFAEEQQLNHAQDTAAHQIMTDWQTTNEAQLLGDAVGGKDIPEATLSWMVRNQLITPNGYNAVRQELVRKGKGTDDMTVYADLDRRSRAGEDISGDLMIAAGPGGGLTAKTALTLQHNSDLVRQRKSDRVTQADFATLRTVAGMDAQEHPMVNLDGQAALDQVALWGQAQREWNQRVLINGENSTAVLADMAPRYGHPTESVRALPRPRMGAIEKLEDIAPVWAATNAAHDAKQMSDETYNSETLLLQKIKQIMDAEAARKSARDTTQQKAQPRPKQQ